MFDRLFLGPSLDRLNAIDQKIEQEKVTIVRDLQFLNYREKINADNAALDKYFVEKVQDDDIVNAEFLRSLEKLANKSKVSLVKSNPAVSKKAEWHNDYYANVDCSGALKDVMTFMYMVNTSDDLLKVVKFSLTPKRGADDSVTASMAIMKRVVPAKLPAKS
jgi:hypothetical protein